MHGKVFSIQYSFLDLLDTVFRVFGIYWGIYKLKQLFNLVILFLTYKFPNSLIEDSYISYLFLHTNFYYNYFHNKSPSSHLILTIFTDTLQTENLYTYENIFSQRVLQTILINNVREPQNRASSKAKSSVQIILHYIFSLPVVLKTVHHRSDNNVNSHRHSFVTNSQINNFHR